jgi:AcrR family transcriptional regulator
MSKAKSVTREKWITTGYELFAEEGPKDIRVERLARMLDLNKSSFYHFFGNLDFYFEQIMVYNDAQANLFIEDIETCKSYDPDFLHTMVKHKLTVLLTMQLVMNRHVPLFFENYQVVTKKIDQSILPLWANFIDIPSKPDVALKYFEQVRDMFFSRVTFDSFTYEFLHPLAHEAKGIVFSISNGKAGQ